MLLGFSAVNTGNNLLFLIVSSLLAFMSITGLAGMLNLQKIFPELLIPNELFAGTPAPFRLRIKNSKPYLPSFMIRIETDSGDNCTIPVISRNSTVEEFFSVTFPARGRAAVGIITVSSIYPVNFFTRYWKFSLEDKVIVFPRLISGPSQDGNSGNATAGSNLRQTRGMDGELERIAEYSGNEPLRLIHWKLSARSDDLFIKEFGSQTIQPLVIDLDEQTGQNLEERISRTAWQVKKQIASRPVGLKLNNRIIAPASGNGHCLHLLTELALYGKD